MYHAIHIVQQNKNGLGHVVRSDRNTPALNVFDYVSAGESKGRASSPLCWKNQVEKDLAVFDVFNCRQTLERGNEWRKSYKRCLRQQKRRKLNLHVYTSS